MKKYSKVIMIIAIILVILLLGGLAYSYYLKATYKPQNPVATIEVEGFGTMKIELYPDMAPNTVTNFITLANRGYYNGTTFHRIVSDFMIQGGDKKGDGSGSPNLSDIKDGGDEKAYGIRGEFTANGYSKNTLRHTKGVISMARADYSQLGKVTEGYNSAGAQFFIMTEENTGLNGLYAAFGKLIEGEDVLDKIEAVEVAATSETEGAEKSKPVEAPIMKSVSVETFGVNYGEPQTLTPFNYEAWFQQQMAGSLSGQ